MDTIEKTELFLKDEKDNLTKLVSAIEDDIKKMDNHLKELSGIENRLYYQIIVKGLNITKAVDKVSFEYDKDVSTIWKNYYPKVKSKIEELENKKIDH